MGSGRWDPDAWASHAAFTASSKPTTEHLFTKRAIVEELDPRNILMRESRDSAANPSATPLIVAQDVTGSMAVVLEHMARHSLGALIEEVYGRKPIADPHICIMAVGDVEFDRAPLQVTQFEAEVAPITSQVERIFLEQGGGGNSYESYIFPWLFAALHTVTDSWEKRKKKGYLFTVGDEQPTPMLRARQVNPFLKTPIEADLTSQQVLDMVSRTWDVFHVIVDEGAHGREPETHDAWARVLGQRVLHLKDHRLLSETIVSAIQVNEGASVHDVAASWSGDTSLVVGHAIKGMVARSGEHGGVVRL